MHRADVDVLSLFRLFQVCVCVYIYIYMHVLDLIWFGLDFSSDIVKTKTLGFYHNPNQNHFFT